MQNWTTPGKAGPGRVLARTLAVGPIGGAGFGALVWSGLCAAAWTPGPWLAGLVFAVPIGAAIGAAVGLVAGLVLAVVHHAYGLGAGGARVVTAAATSLPVLAVFGLANLSAPTYLAAFVLPLATATGVVAALVAPRLVAPVWRAGVSARPSGAAAAGGTGFPGSSPAPGR